MISTGTKQATRAARGSAAHCRGHPRPGDVVMRADAEDPPAVRLGGDEFVVLLPGTDAEGAALVADRIRQSLLEPIAIGPELQLTISAAIGVALATAPEELHHLLRRADAAMYDDKRRAKARR